MGKFIVVDAETVRAAVRLVLQKKKAKLTKRGGLVIEIPVKGSVVIETKPGKIRGDVNPTN